MGKKLANFGQNAVEESIDSQQLLNTKRDWIEFLWIFRLPLSL